MKVQLEKNLDEVKIGFDPVPANWYEVQIVEEPQIKSKEKEVDGVTEMRRNLNIKFTICDDPEFEGKQLFHSCSTEAKYLGYPRGLKETLAALGASWDEDGFDTMDLIGLKCRVKVGQELQRKKNPDTGEYEVDLEAAPRNIIEQIIAIA